MLPGELALCGREPGRGQPNPSSGREAYFPWKSRPPPSFITPIEKPLSGLESPSREKLSPVTLDSSSKCDRRISLAGIQSEEAAISPQGVTSKETPYTTGWPPPSSFQEVPIRLLHSACSDALNLSASEQRFQSPPPPPDPTPRPWNATLLVAEGFKTSAQENLSPLFEHAQATILGLCCQELNPRTIANPYRLPD